MKKFIKQLVYGLGVFLLINFLIVLKYEYPAIKAIKNKTHKNYLKWNSIHNNKNSYDLIILGSSRSYNGFNPKILDKRLNMETFNMGTSAQDIAESYYTLKEILNYQEPRYIILETYFDLSDDTHDYYQIFSNASFFNSTKNKFNLIVEGYGAEGLGSYFIPIMKFSNYIKQDIMTLFQEKPKKQLNKNWYKGFVTNSEELSKTQIKALKPISDFTNSSFNKNRFKTYINKIEQITNSRGIKLIVVRNPYPPARLNHKNNTNDETQFYKDYFEGNYNIKYYDLNDYKKEKFIYKNFHFSDFHHVNFKGAELMSEQLVDLIKNL